MTETQIITKHGSLNTAVLFLVFNRPDVTAQVFEAIRKARPPRLYVAADGARNNKPGEAGLCAEVRRIATAVDWPCEVKTLFRHENLGCKYAVSGAITWFFEQEDKGIILEDDCLPSHSFFEFCETMLEKYKADISIWMINGFNPRYPGMVSSEFFLSQNPSVWGWASWSDRWLKYDVNMSEWKLSKRINFDKEIPRYAQNYYLNAFEKTSTGAINSWDYQLAWLILSNSGYVIKPYANLISNLGVVGTHSDEKDLNHNLDLGIFSVPTGDSLEGRIDLDEDLWFYKTRIKKTISYYPHRILRKLRNLCKTTLGLRC